MTEHNSESRKAKYPKSVIMAFNKDENKYALFMSTLYNYASGRHILELSPLHIYDLSNGVNSKRAALAGIFGVKSEELEFSHISNRGINVLADVAYALLYKGIERKLKSLNLNSYISVDKIINAGNAIKNHNGSKTYGGSTIRDYLTYNAKNERIVDMTEDEIIACNDIISNALTRMKNYKLVKSIPISIFRYKQYVLTDKNNNVTSPDIEAKHNLKRILTAEEYETANIAKLSLTKATVLESKLINAIKKTVKTEMKNISEEYLKEIPESLMKENLKKATNINNIIGITAHGLIHDIVKIMENNMRVVVNLENEPDRIMTEEERKSLLQIEYAALQESLVSPEDDALWLADLKDALNGKMATYGIIKLIIEYACVPYAKGGVCVTEYKIKSDDLQIIMQIAKASGDVKNITEENLKMVCEEIET